ncbi:MAG: tRNA1(Val) A37 N6-methylase TrmN6 [Alphaproteobacteria bacterium]|jgi:tRNA1(Val) A37 N6-methylase TrmN6
MAPNNDLSTDVFPNGVIIQQPIHGFRSGSDALLLADHVIDTYLSNDKHYNILDIGSGGGVISISLLKKNPLIFVTGLELQAEYHALSFKNAITNQCSDRFKNILGDLNQIQKYCDLNSFDFCITNPPFYDHNCGRLPENIQKEIAHYGSIDFISWIRKSLYPLKHKGFLALICRTERLGDAYEALSNRAGNIHIKPIITGKTETIKRVIIVCQKGLKSGTTLLKPYQEIR